MAVQIPEKFKRLERYFENIEVNDLQEFSLDELVQMAEPADKLLMKLFAKKHLIKFLNFPCAMDWNDPFPVSTSEMLVVPKDGNYRDRLFTTAFPALETPPGKIRLEDALKTIIDTEPKVIDFSSNSLFDVDLILIASKITYNPHEVNLSLNRLHGYNREFSDKVDDSLRKILDKTTEYVVIWGNPLASIDKQELFSSFDEKIYNKLIWIPYPWVHAGGWKKMVSNSSFHKIIHDTHMEYYDTK